MKEYAYVKLDKGYLRNIIGFDVRVEPSTLQKTDTLLGSFLHRPAVRVTYEDLVWQKALEEDYYIGRQNGMRLLLNIPDDLYDIEKIPGATLAAFDMPEVYAGWLSKQMFGIETSPLSVVTENPYFKFEFCGFDILSVKTWHSYFYSCNRETPEILEAQKKYSFEINPWGLVGDEETAIRISERFTEEWDEIGRQHGCENKYDPFAPCGIWIAKIGGKSRDPSP